MSNWTYDPSQYQEKNYSVIPIGDHRLRVADVVEKTFSTGSTGFEITFDVSGYNSKLWYYLVLDPSNAARTNQKIGEFFESFGITNPQLGNGKQWIGSVGAGRIVHDTYNSTTKAKVAYFLSRDRQDKLPAWKNGSATTTQAQPGSVAPAVDPQVDLPSDLPFDLV